MKKIISFFLGILILVFPVFASEDISARLEQRLMNETAYISLYYPNLSLASYGDLVYDEVTGEVQLQANGEESLAVTEISVENVEDYADTYNVIVNVSEEDMSVEDMSEEEPDEDSLVVPESYVLLRVAREDGIALLLCMEEKYALSDEELAEKEEAALAELDEWDVLVPRDETSPIAESDSMDDFESESFDLAEEETEEILETEESDYGMKIAASVNSDGDWRSFFHDFSIREYILLIFALVLLLALILCLALLLPYKKRADSIGLSYISMKSAYTKLKRENSRLKTEQLRLEGELVKERGKSVDAALKEFLENQ